MASLMGLLGLVPTAMGWFLVTLVGLLATLIESVIGATVQHRFNWLTNELVNGLQTVIAALIAMACFLLLGLPTQVVA
jgi:uncharacterized membrane protein